MYVTIVLNLPQNIHEKHIKCTIVNLLFALTAFFLYAVYVKITSFSLEKNHKGLIFLSQSYNSSYVGFRT